MIGLARELSRIEGIQHAMYADDITIWINHGSLGQKELIQQAATCVERYVRERGLACSTEKSEVLRVGKKPSKEKIEIRLEGQVLPERSMIRVLGMWIQCGRRCSHTLSLLQQSTQQIIRMITRVSQRRHGMNESDTSWSRAYWSVASHIRFPTTT